MVFLRPMADAFPKINRWETEAGDRMTGSFYETKFMELATGVGDRIDVLIFQSGFEDIVDRIRIEIKLVGFIEARVRFTNWIAIKLNDTHGGDCEMCSLTTGKVVTKNWAYWLPGVESEFQLYKSHPYSTDQDCFAVQKEFNNTTFLDTILVTYYKVVDIVGTIVLAFKVKTNGGASLSLEVEEPALYPRDYGPQKIQNFLNQGTSANIEPGDLFSRRPSYGRKFLHPDEALSSSNVNSCVIS